MPEVDVDTEARIGKLHLVNVLKNTVSRHRGKIQAAIDVLWHPPLWFQTFRHVFEVLAPTVSIMRVVEVDLQIPADEAAAKTLVVLVLDV